MQPKRQTSPWMIVLGVCGGCALICVIGAVIMGTFVMKKGQGLVKGTMTMGMNMPKFLTALRTKNYAGAAALVDPSAQEKLNAESLQKMEEAVESKLGPMQSAPPTMSGQTNTNSPDPTGKSIGGAEWRYSYKLKYEKGTATANFAFKTSDVMNPSGKITDFSIQPDNGS